MSAEGQCDTLIYSESETKFRKGIFCLNSEKDAQVKICEMKSIWK